jgi:ABC-2 type transport system permease protein
MKRLSTLIKKNFKLIMRSKSSAAMIILGPLLLIILVGAAFNTANVYGIRVGTFSEEYSPLSEAIIYDLNQENYLTQKASTEQTCIDGVKNSVFHICAVFPKDLKVAEGGNIQFYVDNTKTNIVYLITDTVSSHIGKKSQDLSFQLTKGVIDVFEDIKEEINDKENLLQEVKSINDEEGGIIKTIVSDLGALKLEYTQEDVSFSLLRSELQKTNQSSSLTGKLESVERDVEELLTETSKAASKVKSTIERLQTISQNAENSKFSITQIELSFDRMKEDIQSVKETGVSKIVNPISSEIKPITTQKTHLNYIFPTLLIMIIMFVSMLLTSTVEIRERISKVYFKNFITPTSETAFMLSNYITNLIIITLQTGILLGAAAFFFYDSITGSITLLLPTLLIITSIFLFLGITIGSLFKTEETNTITVISIGFLMILFSSAILPIETLPELIKNIASFNPFYISEIVLNKIILLKTPLENMYMQFAILLAYLVGAIILAMITKKISKRRQ